MKIGMKTKMYDKQFYFTGKRVTTGCVSFCKGIKHAR